MLSAIFNGLWRRTRQRLQGTPDVDMRLTEARELEEAGDLAGARAACARMLHEFPEHAAVNHRMGGLCVLAGEYEQALAHMKRAVTLDPGLANAHIDLGNLLKLRGEVEAAIAHYRQAITLHPGSTAAHYNLGLLLREVGRPADAFAHLAAAWEAGEFIHVLEDYVLCLIDLDRCDEAIALLEAQVARDPGRAELYFWLGMACQEKHDPDQALRHYRNAHARGLASAEFFTRLGRVLHEVGRFDEALKQYEEALKLRPGFPVALFHRGLIRLLNGDYRRGWPDYEMRLASREVPRRPAHLPRWDGSPLAGRTLLVFGEQGLGDQIMFASCLPEVIERAGHCVIECEPRLVTLFRRSFPGATVCAMGQGDTSASEAHRLRIDTEVPMGTLPLYLRNERASFLRHRGYLRADPLAVEAWRQRLAELGTGPCIGISWCGGSPRTRGHLRSLPLPQWLPILTRRGARFVSLQYTSSAADELAAFEVDTGIRVSHWPEAIDDYDQTAALVAALDLVISVQTAVVHLAGALGRPTWALVAAVPEWRYLLDGADLPWYPTVRLFRQSALNDWRCVVDQIADELRSCSIVATAE